MKKFVGFALMALFAMSVVSCNKCVTCSYEYDNPGTGQTETVTSDEVCGKKSEINDFEEQWVTSAEAAGGKNATCN